MATEPIKEGYRVDKPGQVTIVIPGKPLVRPASDSKVRYEVNQAWKWEAWAESVRKLTGQLPPAEDVVAINWTAFYEMPGHWSKGHRNRMMGTPHDRAPIRFDVDQSILAAIYPGKAKLFGVGQAAKIWGVESYVVVDVFYLQEQGESDAA